MSVIQFLSDNAAVRRILVIFLATTFLFTVAANIYIHIHYSDVMPESPQAQTGRIYRLVVNHGYVVYVNKQELDRANFVFYDLFGAGAACFGLLGLLRLRFKKF